MPHFIIHCSNSVAQQINPDEFMQQVYDEAEATGLFDPKDIKVRIAAFEHYNIGNTKDDFIHVFANIMEGRTDAQKKGLSKRIVSRLKQTFPEAPIISINVRDFEKASYVNRTMV
ncbi:5-carboxymethyl-2-hydroxymuconate Delta-isomerase [Ekhidna sp.]|uniref:5-carboxymethyl-2-hydroxymuconate Delta-isomerase n=1 Tax=Ekhidna sp. TaxID=2608089 RepID=UPI003B59AEDE